jgi:hypothetical protein
MVISGNNLVINGTTVEAADLTNVASITSDVQTQLNSKANTSTVNSQVWDYSQMPVGSVLQVVTRTPFVANYNIATTSEIQLTEYNTTINKKFANSKIVCFVTLAYYYNSDPDYWWLKARVNGTHTTSCVNSWQNSFLTSNSRQFTFRESAHQTASGHFWDTTNTTTANYTFIMQKSGNANMSIWGENAHMLTFMEIKQ